MAKRKTNKGIIHEFNKFWKRLDHYQQFSLLSLAIISLSVAIGISAIQSQQLLQSQAFQTTFLGTPSTSEYPTDTDKYNRSRDTSCVIAGCSGELCVDSSRADQGIGTICLWQDEYACYQRFGQCETQADGQCGWTPTSDLRQCLANHGVSINNETKSDPRSSVIQEVCRQSGGAWRTFSNGCADLCGVNPGDACTMALTDSCDCGPTACWDGSRCVNQTDTDTKDDSRSSVIQEVCRQSGGTWRTFSDGCADQCGISPGDACITVMTDSCDCGPTACWDGSRCVHQSVKTPDRDSDQPPHILPIPTTATDKATSPDRQACLSSGGTWEQFPNSCVDSCERLTDPLLACLQVITDGCNCGPASCWDGNTCVPHPRSTSDDPLSQFGFSSRSLQDIFNYFRNFFRFSR